MAGQKITDFILYRWRYVFGYLLFAAALIVVLVIAGFYVPGGLTKAEITSALISEHLHVTQLFNLQPDSLVYLPYRLLQSLSINQFGFTVIGIKLPSIILAFLSGIGLVFLLNLWFRRNIAIIAAIIAVTTNQFLLAGQSGHSGITYVFLPISILVAAWLITSRSALASIWVICGFILAGISLYMPLNVYVLVALVLTTLTHPHARHAVVHKASKMTFAVGFLLFLAIISPLVFGIIHDLSLLSTLLGIPADWGAVLGNAETLLRQYGQIYTPVSGAVLVPVYGLGILLLMVLGVYRLISTKYTTKSYIISFWLILLVPLVFLNPSFITITFLPVVLLLALGLDYLVWYWYRLFPRNPYARLFGLIPLGVLIVGLVATNIDRYAYGYYYDVAVYKDYNFDLSLLQRKLRHLDGSEPVYLVVDKSQLALYQSYNRHQHDYPKLNVSDTLPLGLKSGTIIVQSSLRPPLATTIPSEILVTQTSTNADRFYLYKISAG